MRRNVRDLLTVLLIAIGMLGAVVSAQLSSVAPEWLRGGPALVGQKLRVCIQTATPLTEFETSLAAEIAAINLLDLEIYSYDRPPLGMNDASIVVLLTNECDLLMGLPFMPAELVGVYPEHLEYSREYYRTGYVLVTLASRPENSVSDFASDDRIGTLQTSAGDLQLTIFLQTASENRRPRRVPYPSEELLYTRLIEGQLDAALLTQHHLARLARAGEDADLLKQVALPPRYNFQWGVGAGLMAGNIYVKTLVDESIDALKEYGIIEELIELHELPGHVPD